MPRKTISVIGYGNFGKLVVAIILKHLPTLSVKVSNQSQRPGRDKSVDFVDFETACACDVVIPCVPISAFEEVVKKAVPFLKNGSLFVDVCSVKKFPVEVMNKHLPKEVNVLATHPMFGPNSTNGSLETLKGLRIVLHNVRMPEKDFKKVKSICSDKLGLKVVLMSPDEHDKTAAFSQVFVHLIGNIGLKMGLKSTKINTKWFDYYMRIQEAVKGTGFELFNDMNRFNPYTKEMVRAFGEKFDVIEKQRNVKVKIRQSM